MIQVGVAVEDMHVLDRLDGCHDRFNHFWTPGFGIIGNAFD